jgi:hypothetical protein
MPLYHLDVDLDLVVNSHRMSYSLRLNPTVTLLDSYFPHQRLYDLNPSSSIIRSPDAFYDPRLRIGSI